MPDVFMNDFLGAKQKLKIYIDDPIITALFNKYGAAILPRIAGAIKAGSTTGTSAIMNDYIKNGSYVPRGPAAAPEDPRTTVAGNSFFKPNTTDTNVQAILNRGLPGYTAEGFRNVGVTGNNQLYLDDNILKGYLLKYGMGALFRINELNDAGFINNQSNSFTEYLKTGYLADLTNTQAAAPEDRRVDILNAPPSRVLEMGRQLGMQGFPGYSGFAANVPSVRDVGTDDAYKLLEEELTRMGFKNMTDWAKQFVESGKPIELLEPELRKTPEFAARFPAIISLQKMRDANPALNVLVPTPQEYMEYERSVSTVLANAGLFNLATRDNVQKWIEGQKSVQELADIISNGYERVANAPQEVRDAFNSFYGIGTGDAALASFFVNTQATAEQIRQQVGAGFAGGAAQMNNIGLGRNLAERVSDLGISFQEALQGFGRVNTRRGLLRGTASQGAYSMENAIQGEFGLNSFYQRELQRRLEERTAAFGGGGGAALGNSTIAIGSAI